MMMQPPLPPTGNDPLGGVAAPPVTLHDVTVLRRKKVGIARVETVPPEEFGISRRAKSIRPADYCFHETETTQDALVGEGFDRDSVEALPTGEFDTTEEAQARDTVDDRESGSGSSNMNRGTRIVRVCEHYIRMDYEGDGKPCLYRVTTAGDGGDVLYRKGKPAIDKIDEMPFAALTPYIVTHRFFGRSAADMIMDIQRIKTALLRQLLDNAYLANNQRTEIAESHATRHTIDDLLTNRPGGIVRTKTPGGLNVIQNQEIGGFAFPLLEYADKQREWRTGVTRQGQGIGANDLQNIGEQAVLQFNSMAQARMRLIARIFAETGIRDLFLLLHSVIRSNASTADTVRLKNKWVPVDPRAWKRRSDMTVSVGLGSGSKDQQGMFLLQLLGIQKEAMMAPGQPLVKWENIYNTLKKLVQVGGLKSIDPYFSDPKAQPPEQGQPPPDPKMMEAQAKLKLQEQETAATLKMREQEGMLKLRLQMQTDEARLAADMKRVAMEHDARLAELAMKERMAVRQQDLEAQLRREQMDLEARTALGTQVVKGAMEPEPADDSISDVRMGGEIG